MLIVIANTFRLFGKELSKKSEKYFIFTGHTILCALRRSKRLPIFLKKGDPQLRHRLIYIIIYGPKNSILPAKWYQQYSYVSPFESIP